MTLYEKITTLYTELTDADFAPEGTIMLQNDSDGKGDYIKEWNHPTVTQPTNAELNGVS
jgi:hypothetical protein